MHTKGYIKIPRSINTLPLTSRVMMMHLCSECQYCDAEHPVVGTLHVGEIVTSRNALNTLLDLSVQEVRTALAWLESNGYIKVEATARYTKITVLWQDFLALNGFEIMLNNQVNNQASNQVSNQVSTSASVENTSSCKDEKILLTKSPTKYLTKSPTNNNIKYIENNNTHTSNSKYLVKTKNAPARDARTHTSDTHEQVQELARYIAQEVPQFQAMKHPFTVEDLTDIVEAHSLDDARVILRQAWSKEAYIGDTSARVVFDKYAERYYAYHPQATPIENSRLLTYSEMLAEFNKIGYGTTADHFDEAGVLGADGKKRWVRVS